MMRSPCPPRRFGPLPHETQVLRTILARRAGRPTVSAVGGRRREPGPRAGLPKPGACVIRVERLDLDMSCSSQWQRPMRWSATDWRCTPIIGAGMLDRVDVDRLPVQPPEGDVAELSGQDLSERRPTRRGLAKHVLVRRPLNRSEEPRAVSDAGGATRRAARPCQVVRGGSHLHEHDVGLAAQELAEALVTLRLVGEVEAASPQEHRRTEAIPRSRCHDSARARLPPAP